MLWFYARAGNVQQHGIADLSTLHAMALKGEITENDLVWDAKTGTEWIRAANIRDIFPKTKLKVTERKQTKPREIMITKPEVSKKQKAPTNYGMLILQILLIIAILIAAIIVWSNNCPKQPLAKKIQKIIQKIK